jgi:hypothetical protein
MQIDGRRYWYLIHSRILKFAWKWKSKTYFNTLDGWSNFATKDYIRRHRGFFYLALPITPCALTFPSLETSRKPLRRRECGSLIQPNLPLLIAATLILQYGSNNWNKLAKEIYTYSRRFFSTMLHIWKIKCSRAETFFISFFRDILRFERDFPLFGYLETFLPFGT